MASLKLKHSVPRSDRRSAMPYAPDILPQMQSLLATLADIDSAFERDLETVAASTIAEPFKRKAIAALRQLHHARCVPYLQEITALQKRIQPAST